MKFPDLSKIKITTYLGIISILGFFAIFVQSAFDIDISLINESLLFVLIGGYLLGSGGYYLIFNYFKDGLTANEVNKIMAVVIGFFSVLMGVLLLFNIELDIFRSIRIFISIFAMIIITFETLLSRGGK